MKKMIEKQPILSCTIIFLICGIARLIEYFVIRTDETIISENFLHKVFGIIVLTLMLYLLHYNRQSIGFTKHNMLSGIVKGLALGTCCFIIAYSIESLILYCMNKNVSLSLYASGFSLNGEAVKQKGILLIVVCIIFNIINVCMEEGIFRGLFTLILTPKMSFLSATLFIAFLFGIWHWIMPLRDYIEGSTSLANLLVMGIGYIILAGIMSIKWSILYRMTGALWMALGDHLFNNVVVTNLLHVISNNEVDSMQIVRVMIGQMLSFAIVMIFYMKTAKNVRDR